jgi:hypothetical protein
MVDKRSKHQNQKLNQKRKTMKLINARSKERDDKEKSITKGK